MAMGLFSELLINLTRSINISLVQNKGITSEEHHLNRYYYNYIPFDVGFVFKIKDE